MEMQFRKLRIILIVLAIALVLIPVLIVSITDHGLGALAANILISASILSLIGAILIGLDRHQKSKAFSKLGISIGLLIILVAQWL